MCLTCLELDTNIEVIVKEYVVVKCAHNLEIFSQSGMAVVNFTRFVMKLVS